MKPRGIVERFLADSSVEDVIESVWNSDGLISWYNASRKVNRTIRRALKKARKENEALTMEIADLRQEIAELCDGDWKRRNAE